jgi:hypothetical protein
MEIERARLLAERLHADDFEEDGTALLEHVRRVVCRVDADAQVVAWLHEVLEWTVVAEDELLREGLEGDELRALRLLYRADDARSDGVYLAHVGLIARAAGRAGRLARLVKIADLQDRCLHPRVRADGWSPPYARGLALLIGHGAGRATIDDPPGNHIHPTWTMRWDQAAETIRSKFRPGSAFRAWSGWEAASTPAPVSCAPRPAATRRRIRRSLRLKRSTRNAAPTIEEGTPR